SDAGRASAGSAHRTTVGAAGAFAPFRLTEAGAGSASEPGGRAISNVRRRGSATSRTGRSPVFSTRSVQGPPPGAASTVRVRGGGANTVGSVACASAVVAAHAKTET